MSRIWSKVSKVVGALFLYGGGTTSLALITAIVLSHATGGILAALALVLIFFGLAPASLGGWLLHAGSKLERQAMRERFFQLLHASQGKVSVLDFAANARLEPAIARQHLDDWAKEFSATFEVSDEGNIYYIFAKDPVLLPEMNNLGALGQAMRQWL
jgi:hypothetical protein